MATSTLGSGTLVLAGTTSGTTTVTATAVAGTTTLTLPAATDTLVGRATTDTLTNKTLTGAAMNGTLGATTPSTGAFTTVSATGSVTGTTLNSIRPSGSQPEVVIQQTGIASWSIYNPPSSTDLRFYNGSDLLTLNSTSLYTASTINVGIGTSSPVNKLVVSNAGANGLEVNPNSGVSSGASLNGYNRSTLAFTPLTYTALSHHFQVGSTPATAATLDSSGNLIQSAPTTAPTLSTNGTMVFNLTSNTNLRVSVRGSDGVTRTANLTLA